MPDFMDRFGDQMRAAEAVLPPRPDAAPRSRRGRAWSPGKRPALLVCLGALALAAPALALIQPWHPQLRRPLVDRPVAVDSTPVVAAARDVLGVLRRSQTTDDQLTAGPLLKAVGMGNQVDLVQTDFIRALTDDWALVPARTVQSGLRQTQREVLCITNGKTLACSPVASVVDNGVGALTASESQTSIAGLVPDSVAGVRFTPEHGAAVEVPVRSNFYSLSVPETGVSSPVPAPAGYDGPATIPGPPVPVAGTLEWLNAEGRVIGPAQPHLR